MTTTDEIWWPERQAGAIIWCRFPDTPVLKPAPKPRPALLLTVFDDDAPQFRVLVAYGTSQKVNRLYAADFAITPQDGAAFNLAGSSFPTRFNLLKAVELPYSTPWFDAEEALREANRRKDKFLATLSHELRNPLAPLRTGLELMRMVSDDPAKVQECRAIMERQVEHLIRLVDDLLDVSRITRGRLELKRGPHRACGRRPRQIVGRDARRDDRGAQRRGWPGQRVPCLASHHN